MISIEIISDISNKDRGIRVALLIKCCSGIASYFVVSLTLVQGACDESIVRQAVHISLRCRHTRPRASGEVADEVINVSVHYEAEPGESIGGEYT